MSRDMITRFLNGQTSPTLDTVDRLAAALALDLVMAGAPPAAATLASPLPLEETAGPLTIAAAEVLALDLVNPSKTPRDAEETGENVETGLRPDFIFVTVGNSEAPPEKPEPPATDSQLGAEAGDRHPPTA